MLTAAHGGRLTEKQQQALTELETGGFATATAWRLTDGLIALMFASHKGYRGEVEALIAQNTDVNATDSEGSTALTTASLNGHKDIIELFRRAGAK
ncbi:hypothetical protein DFAR_2370001 [Desulfarculales bacterium]